MFVDISIGRAMYPMLGFNANYISMEIRKVHWNEGRSYIFLFASNVCLHEMIHFNSSTK